jgi:membrane protease YdiL (CAAX protease family)
MLFLVKRTWPSALLALVLLTLLALALRPFLPAVTPITLSVHNALIGVAVVVVVLVSDATLHGFFGLLFGERYKQRHRELAAVFRGQSFSAFAAGAALAGVGEELIFRGMSTDLAYLIPSAVVFGLLHHIRRSLWPFTLWAIWEGLLFAVALWYFRDLVVTMVAHFLHDFAGFLIFRYLNARESVR